jgi:hypothetical protein
VRFLVVYCGVNAPRKVARFLVLWMKFPLPILCCFAVLDENFFLLRCFLRAAHDPPPVLKEFLLWFLCISSIPLLFLCICSIPSPSLPQAASWILLDSGDLFLCFERRWGRRRRERGSRRRKRAHTWSLQLLGT